ncbi:MAG: hypothetical protein M0R77_07760 [Gammaproteobacteria bacterium]|nr:hypothetical protein [Gammaproteobacteria bacterium]
MEAKKGKPVSMEAARLRFAVSSWAKEKKPGTITSKSLAERFGATVTNTNNALAWAEKQGIVRRAGHADKEGKGRKPVVWQPH